MSQRDKGFHAEEALRAYFRNLGYFAVRGVSVRFDGTEITDLDLWLYLKSSAVSRERTNVDVRLRKSSKPLERILWAKGVQATIGTDSAIVATRNRRPLTAEFAAACGVSLIDGDMLRKIMSRGFEQKYLTDEELVAAWNMTGVDKHVSGIADLVSSARSRLAESVDFDSVNATLDDARKSLKALATAGVRAESISRATYLLCAYFLVQCDIATARFALSPPDHRHQRILDGLRFGAGGAARIDDTLAMVRGILDAHVDATGSTSRGVVDKFRSDLMSLRVEGLAEYLADNRRHSTLFKLARQFEEAAYQREFVPTTKLAVECRSLLGALADFADVARKFVLRDSEGGSSDSDQDETLDGPFDSKSAEDGSQPAGENLRLALQTPDDD